MTEERAKPEFVSGLFVKTPEPSQPSFIIAKLGIRREELIDWLEGKEGEWVNIDIKESRSGKWYAQVDNWKPTQRKEPEVKKDIQHDFLNPDYNAQDYTRKEDKTDNFDDDIPF